jgi:hypothetical protein
MTKIEHNSESPFFIHLKNDEISLYSSQTDNEILNFERGLASLFLFKNEEWSGQESDCQGKCKTSYKLDHHGLQKNKENCLIAGQANSEVNQMKVS